MGPFTGLPARHCWKHVKKSKHKTGSGAGEARITEACDLKAKYVIHTVGPRYKIDKNPETLLAPVYGSSLDLTVSHGCSSIAFPAIACGSYGYTPEEAAKISVSVYQRPEYASLIIYFYLFSDKMTAIWTSALAESQNRLLSQGD